MFRRIFLFLLTNFLIIVTISIVGSIIMAVFNISPAYLSEQGLDYKTLLIYCVIWGFAGSFISLALSRIMAKKLMNIRLIDPDTSDAREQGILKMIEGQVKKLDLSMPEVGIYESEEVNAFATGPTASRALVAISSGLLQNMNKDEVEGVIGHEVSHIGNGDMVTMTLLQGIINSFVLFFSRILAVLLSAVLARGNEDTSRGINVFFVMIFEIALSFLGMIVVAWFSRQRELRADVGGAELTGKNKMISALEALKHHVEDLPDKFGKEDPASLSTLKISREGLSYALFATHPPLEERIRRLRQLNIKAE